MRGSVFRQGVNVALVKSVSFASQFLYLNFNVPSVVRWDFRGDIYVILPSATVPVTFLVNILRSMLR